jgi:hypothetical protein
MKSASTHHVVVDVVMAVAADVVMVVHVVDVVMAAHAVAIVIALLVFLTAPMHHVQSALSATMVLAQSALSPLAALAHVKAHHAKVDSVKADSVTADPALQSVHQHHAKVDSVTVDHAQQAHAMEHHAKVDSVTADHAQQAHAMAHHALQLAATAVHATQQLLVQAHHAQVDHVKVVSAVHAMVSRVAQQLAASLTERQRAKSATNTGATKSPGSKLPTRIGFTSINRSAIPKIMIPPVALISCTIRSVRIASRPEAPSVIRP